MGVYIPAGHTQPAVCVSLSVHERSNRVCVRLHDFSDPTFQTGRPLPTHWQFVELDTLFGNKKGHTVIPL